MGLVVVRLNMVLVVVMEENFILKVFGGFLS